MRIEALALQGLTKQLALNSVWSGRDGDALRLTLDVKHKHLLTEARRSELQDALRVQMQTEVHLVVDIGIGSLDTPAAQQIAAEDARQKAAAEAIASDESVQAFQKYFCASVRVGSIKAQ